MRNLRIQIYRPSFLLAHLSHVRISVTDVLTFILNATTARLKLSSLSVCLCWTFIIRFESGCIDCETFFCRKQVEDGSQFRNLMISTQARGGVELCPGILEWKPMYTLARSPFYHSHVQYLVQKYECKQKSNKDSCMKRRLCIFKYVFDCIVHLTHQISSK